jgi:hypothetical protein
MIVLEEDSVIAGLIQCMVHFRKPAVFTTSKRFLLTAGVGCP